MGIPGPYPARRFAVKTVLFPGVGEMIFDKSEGVSIPLKRSLDSSKPYMTVVA